MINEKCAVIVIDFQNDYVHENGRISKFGLGTERIRSMIPNVERLLNNVRVKNIPIIHFQMTEDPELIEKSLKDKRINAFGSPENWALAIPGTWGHELVLAPKENEPIFQKNASDVFSNNELKKLLEEKEIKTLIIIGGYTHACVDASVRSAIKNGYDVVLVTDLVNSPDRLQELHEASLKVLTTQFAHGTTSDEIIKLIDYNHFLK